MALSYISVAVSGVSYTVPPPFAGEAPPAEPDRLQVRCSVVGANGAPLDRVWRKGAAVADSAARESAPLPVPRGSREKPSTASTFPLSYQQNSRAVALSPELLNELANAFIVIEVLDPSGSASATDTGGGKDGAATAQQNIGAVHLSVAPFLSHKRLHGGAHAVPLTLSPARSAFRDGKATVAVSLSGALWAYCRRAKTLCLQQLMVQNLPEAWGEGSLFDVTVRVPLLDAGAAAKAAQAAADGGDAAPDSGSAGRSTVDVTLPRAALTDGTLTWASGEPAASAVFLGAADDDHVPLRWVFLDRQAAVRLRAAAEDGQALTVKLDRLVPDKKKELRPDAASACVASFRLDGGKGDGDGDGGGGGGGGDGSGGSGDSLLDDGATAVAAAVPLRPAAAGADPAAHPVAAAQSAAFVALKLSAPLAAARGARVTGGLTVAQVLQRGGGGQEQQAKAEKKFSAVHESEEVLRSYLRETIRVLLAEHALQFGAAGGAGGDNGALPPVEEQRRRVREGLDTNGFGVLVADNLKYAVVGLLRERFRADQLKLDNARQSSTVLIDLCAFLEEEVEAAVAAAGAGAASRGSSRAGAAVAPLLILAYDAEADGDVSRALRFHHQHTAEAEAAATAGGTSPRAVAMAWAELAKCHVRAGQTVEGSIAAQEALARDPSSVQGAVTFAAVLLQKQLNASTKDATASHMVRALEALEAAMASPPAGGGDDARGGANLADHLYHLANAIAAHHRGDPLPAGNSTDAEETANHLAAVNLLLVGLGLTQLAEAALDTLRPRLAKLPRTARDADALRTTADAYGMLATFQRGDDDGVEARAAQVLRRLGTGGGAADDDGADDDNDTAGGNDDDDDDDHGADSTAGGEGEGGDAAAAQAVKAAKAAAQACDDACFWRVLAQSRARRGGDPGAALAAFDRALECADETFGWTAAGGMPSRVRLLLAAGGVCAAPAPDGLGDVARAGDQYLCKAAALGACPSVWFRLGRNCAARGQLGAAEDAFAKVTAMDNAHAAVWAELAKLSLRADPPRHGDARQYADQAFEHRLSSRARLGDLADAFLAAADSGGGGDPGAVASARTYADRCLRQSLARGEDPAVRARLAGLQPSADEREACAMFLSPRKGPALE